MTSRQKWLNLAWLFGGWTLGVAVPIAIIVAAASCGGPGAAPPTSSSPQDGRSERAVVLADRHAWCESCRDLPILGVGPRVARRGSR